MKETIRFKNTMTPYQYAGGAFLKSKFVSPSDHLIPVADFAVSAPPNALEDSSQIVWVQADNASYGFGLLNGSSNLAVIRVNGIGTITQVTSAAGSANIPIQGAAYSPRDNKIYIVDVTGEIHRFDLSTDTLEMDWATGSTESANAIVFHPSDSNLYRINGTGIDRINTADGTVSTNVLTVLEGVTSAYLIPFGDYLGIVTEDSDTAEVQLSLWDRRTDVVGVNREIPVAYGQLLAVAVLRGRLTIVVSESRATNSKFVGKWVMYQLVGNFFQEVNFLETKDTLQSPGGFYADNNDIYICSDRAESIANPGIYKFSYDGSVVLAQELSNIGTQGRFKSVTRQANNLGNLIATFEDDSDTIFIAVEKIAEADSSTDNDIYDLPSTYTTEWFGDGFNTERLDYFNLGVEKFGDGSFTEKAEVYYQTDENMSPVLLGSIDQTVDGDISKKQFTKLADGSMMPRLEKIRFDLVSSKGARIIYAAFKSDPISNNPSK